MKHSVLYVFKNKTWGHSWLFTWKKILLKSPCCCKVTHRSHFSVKKCGNFVTWTISIRNSRLQKSGSDEWLYSSGVTHDVCSHNVISVFAWIRLWSHFLVFNRNSLFLACELSVVSWWHDMTSVLRHWVSSLLIHPPRPILLLDHHREYGALAAPS